MLHAAREVLCGVLGLAPPVESMALYRGESCAATRDCALRPRGISRALLPRTVFTKSPGTRVAPTSGWQSGVSGRAPCQCSARAQSPARPPRRHTRAHAAARDMFPRREARERHASARLHPKRTHFGDARHAVLDEIDGLAAALAVGILLDVRGGVSLDVVPADGLHLASRSGRTLSGWSCRTGSGHERGFVRFEIGRHVGRARRRVARRAAFVGVRENAMRRYSESTAYVEHARCQNFMQRKPVCKNVKVSVLHAM